MKKRLIVAIFTIVFGVSSISAQKDQGGISQLPQVEPFKISPGSSFSASGPRNQTRDPKNQLENSKLSISDDFSEAMEIINRNYINGNKLDRNELAKNSITSMLRTLDPHSNYFDPAEFQELLDDQHSEYFGIGASIASYIKEGVYETYVTSTFPDSPAQRTNLRFGDKILAVNGESMRGKTAGYVADKVRGPKGSSVKIRIQKSASNETRDFEIVRNRVIQPSIPDAYILRPGIGYINLENGFNYTTSEEFDVALQDLEAAGATSLILDLRDNPGGIVEQAVKVAEKFLDRGQTVLSQRGRYKIDSRTWKSRSRTTEILPLVLLVNEGSASASEIVAGALQDYDRALIVGDNTFGKGLVQSVLTLPYGSGLTLTTARYYTPSGRSIQRDYSSENLYDYFNHKNESVVSDKMVTTAGGRPVYGGNGIKPDEIVKNEGFNLNQTRLLDSLFFFSRDVVNGEIEGFESYTLSNPIKYGHRISAVDFPVDDILFGRFRSRILGNADLSLKSAEIDSEKEFIKLRIRYNLIAAHFGNVAANQVLIEDDRQVGKAVESLPRAKQLAMTARGLKNK